MNECPFCDELVLKNQAYYESKLTAVLYNHKPILPGHSLVIPKRHVERFEEMTREEISEIGDAIKVVDNAFKKVYNSTASTIIMQNGRDAGQTVFHAHFHVTPRKRGDMTNTELYGKVILEKLGRKKLDEKEIKVAIEKLKKAIVVR